MKQDLLALAARANLRMLGWLLPRMPPGDRSWIARRVMQDRFAPGPRAMAGFFSQAMLAWKNKQYDVTLNGEEALLRRLAPFRPKVVLDVGANVGDWALAACRHLPEATVHAFEIAPTTAEELARHAAALSDRLVVNRMGLSDREGTIEIFRSPESSTATSTLRHALAVGEAEHGVRTVLTETARVTTGDAYLAARDIARVDILKIDVEGAEPAVLAGFQQAFDRQAITLVQFEYGPLNIATRHMLADFHAFFEPRGYALGKLLPEGVAFKPYEIADEDFCGPNFIACRAERTDIIEALRCAPLRAD